MAKYLPDMRVGDDYKIKLTVSDTLDVIQDITGFEFWITLKASFDDLDDAAVLQFKTTVGDYSLDDATNGICYIVVPAATTKLVPVGKYYYDIQQKDGTNITTVLPPIEDYKDRLTVVPEVTKAIT